MASFLVHTARDVRRPIDPADIYYLEARGRDTRIRRRRAKALIDVRELHELTPLLPALGLLQIHRAHAVNPAHILEIRKRKGRQDWEVKLAPPVNEVLPIARDYLDAVWAHFGED